MPAFPYYEEEPTRAIIEYTMPMMPDIETSYQMDHKTLMFIANGGATQPVQATNQRFKPAIVSCYDCGGDHYVKDCPNQKERNSFPPFRQFCGDCGVKHLIQDCPSNLEAKGKIELKYVKVLPSESACSSDSDQVIPLKIITRAQAKAKGENS